MGSVINSKQEKEKKAAAAEDKRKKERRRMKELGGINGAETPEDDEEGEEKHAAGLPTKQINHIAKGQRSLSPAFGRMENGHSNIAATLNGTRSNSPQRFSGTTGTKDSFLNYFFGKEGGLPGGPGTGAATATSGGRHVSHSTEPSFSQSIRRGDNRMVERGAPMQNADSDPYDSGRTGRSGYEGYNSPFVSALSH
jgi:dynamin 1-like protein